MDKIKIGIIGCGIAARDLHLPALNRLKDKFEITAVCNHTLDKAKSFSDLVGGVPYFKDYHDLLNRQDVDAVDVVLPIGLNPKVTHDALRTGKHIMVEKPLAANLVDARKMLDLDKQYPQTTMVAENYRYRPGLLRMKELINDGMIGNPYAVFWNYFGLMQMSNKYAQTKWRINHTFPGGFVTDGGIHNIAGIRMLFGDIVAGSSFSGSQNPEIGKLDTLNYQFTTESGVKGILNIFISCSGYSENRIIVLGTKASIILTDGILTINDESGEKLSERFEDDRGYYEEFVDFYKAVKMEQPPVSNFYEAYKDLETLLTAQENADEWAFQVGDR